MQPTEVRNYLIIDKAVTAEVTRLMSESKTKAEKIEAALTRLYLAVMYRCPELEASCKKFTTTKIYLKDVEVMDLGTTDAMLKACLSEWKEGSINNENFGYSGKSGGYEESISLYAALNIATFNPFNPMGGTFGPLWGKSQALKNVEASLAKT
jgi:hypothetical protein